MSNPDNSYEYNRLPFMIDHAIQDGPCAWPFFGFNRSQRHPNSRSLGTASILSIKAMYLRASNLIAHHCLSYLHVFLLGGPRARDQIAVMSNIAGWGTVACNISF